MLLWIFLRFVLLRWYTWQVQMLFGASEFLCKNRGNLISTSCLGISPSQNVLCMTYIQDEQYGIGYF